MPQTRVIFTKKARKRRPFAGILIKLKDSLSE
jgi:hypothetical protein